MSDSPAFLSPPRSRSVLAFVRSLQGRHWSPPTRLVDYTVTFLVAYVPNTTAPLGYAEQAHGSKHWCDSPYGNRGLRRAACARLDPFGRRRRLRRNTFVCNSLRADVKPSSAVVLSSSGCVPAEPVPVSPSVLMIRQRFRSGQAAGCAPSEVR